MPSEFEVIRRYFTHPAQHTVLGVGDDAALVRVRHGCELALSADMLVAGQHFFSDADPYRLGHKALAVNLSDLAAMGATPRWVTLALALPRVDAPWLRAFSRGFMALAHRYQVDLVGGDTTRGPLNICVQIMGEVPRGAGLRRDGAQPGDDIWVSGSLGDAALAVAGLMQQLPLTPQELARCARRLHTPQPRVALGCALRGVAHSAIDISDGLLADLGHILERSQVAAEIEWTALPRSSVMRKYADRAVARKALLAGGDDYELCFTAPVHAKRRIARVGSRLDIPLTPIGRIRQRARGVTQLIIRGPDGRPVRVTAKGYDHFR